MTFHKWVETFLLGVLQGVSEFLPISSSGHLVLTQNFFKMEDVNLLLVLVLHAGSLLAILIHYKKDFLYIIKGFLTAPFNIKGSARPFYLCLFGLIPSLVLGFAGANIIDKYFFQLGWTGLGFLMTGFVLFFTLFFIKPNKISSAESEKLKDKYLQAKEDWLELSYKKAFLIGCAQALAFIPGISRAGWTISAGLFLKIPHRLACSFSFFLAIPAITGGVLWSVFYSSENLPALTTTNGVAQVLSLSLAFFSSWLFSHLALNTLIRSLENKYFPFFAFYLWPLGCFTLIYCILIAI